MANRYWVGGTNTWNTTPGTKWALTSGGAGGQAVPTSSDDVFFDASSGTGTCTISGVVNCRNFDTTGYTGTLRNTTPFGTLNIYGNFTIGAAAATYSFWGTNLNFASTSTGKTITMNGKTLTYINNVTFNGSGGGWTLQDNFSISSNVTLSAGTLNINSKTITCGVFSALSGGTRAITNGTATYNVTGYNLNSSTTVTGTVALVINTTGDATISGDATLNFASVSITQPSSTTKLDVVLDQNITISGTLTMSTSGTSQRPLLRSSVLGTQRTVSAATTTLSNSNFRDINGIGGGTWAGTVLADEKGNTGITFKTPETLYAINLNGSSNIYWDDTTKWSLSSGGTTAGKYPTPSDNVVFDSSSLSGSFTGNFICRNRGCKNLTINTGAAANVRCDMSSSAIYGDLYIAGTNATLYSSSGDAYLRGRGAQTINCTGTPSVYATLVAEAVGGTYTFSNNFTGTATAPMTLSNGTLDLNGKTITTGQFIVSGTNTRTLTMGAAVLNCAGFNAGTTTNLTFNKGTSEIISTSTFTGGSLTYNKVTALASLTIAGSNTFAELAVDATAAARTITFTAGTTQTVTAFTAVGSSGKIITLKSSSAGTQWTISSATATITCDYISVQDSYATGGAVWDPGVNSINAGGNTGWSFPIKSGFMAFL